MKRTRGSTEVGEKERRGSIAQATLMVYARCKASGIEVEERERESASWTNNTRRTLSALRNTEEAEAFNASHLVGAFILACCAHTTNSSCFSLHSVAEKV